MQTRLEIQRVYREHHGWVLARLVRSVRDLDLAEDALQDALITALDQWPVRGVPDDPRRWLVVAARNRAIDELRRRTMRSKKNDELEWLASLEREVAAGEDGPIRDDMLRLVFTCCHPALAEEARVALTLRAIAGLETEEIARAFLVPNATMAQRLVRAKKKIRGAKIPFVVPDEDAIDERVAGVLAVVYLVFNEGYSATHGAQVVRRDMCKVALRLGAALAQLLDDHPEAFGLLGLMLLHDARSAARASESGELVLLEAQDRGRWNQAQIAEGIRVTKQALRLGRAGPYALQAAIAAVHAEAPTADVTDWAQIVALYDHLLARAPTPVVALNRAVAVAMRDGPEAGLAEVDALADALDGYHLFHAARADLLRRLGRYEAAAKAYTAALAAPCNEVERRFLEGRLAEVRGAR